MRSRLGRPTRHGGMVSDPAEVDVVHATLGDHLAQPARIGGDLRDPVLVHLDESMVDAVDCSGLEQMDQDRHLGALDVHLEQRYPARQVHDEGCKIGAGHADAAAGVDVSFAGVDRGPPAEMRGVRVEAAGTVKHSGAIADRHSAVDEVHIGSALHRFAQALERVGVGLESVNGSACGGQGAGVNAEVRTAIDGDVAAPERADHLIELVPGKPLLALSRRRKLPLGKGTSNDVTQIHRMMLLQYYMKKYRISWASMSLTRRRSLLWRDGNSMALDPRWMLLQPKTLEAA